MQGASSARVKVYRGSSRGRAGRRGQQAARRMPECRAVTAWRPMQGDGGCETAADDGAKEGSAQNNRPRESIGSHGRGAYLYT